MRLTRTDRVPPVPLSGPLGPFDFAVAGSLSGIGNDTFKPTPNWVPSGTSAAFGSATTISGVVRSASGFADGRFEASITFSRNNVSSTCPAGVAAWTLNDLD
jgi:hypothetical protein